jgi:hypothetical protein
VERGRSARIARSEPAPSRERDTSTRSETAAGPTDARAGAAAWPALLALQRTAGNAAVCKLVQSSARLLQRQVAIGPPGAKPLTEEALVEQLKSARAAPEVIKRLSVWAGDKVPRRYDTIEAAIIAATNELTISSLPLKPPSARLGPPPPRTGESRPPNRPPPELPSERRTGQTVGRPAEQPIVLSTPQPIVPSTPHPVVPPRPPRTLPPTSPPGVPDVQHGRPLPDTPQPARREGPQQVRSLHHAVPRRAQGPMWRDIPRDVQVALEEAYAAHQKSPFKGHDDLYENWYKKSAKKGSKEPGPEQVEAYEKQVRRHLPELKPAVHGEYRYVDQAGQYPAVRIYVNPLPEHAAEVVANVAKLARDIPGYIGSKIGDAGVAHTSRDVFVIYLDGRLVSDGDRLSELTRKVLGEYHRHNEEKFVDEVPRLTHPVLKGVSIGAEPPGGEALSTALTESPIGTRATTPEGEPEEHHLESSWTQGLPFSFSTYRARLIFEALQSTHDEESYRLRILDNFAIAGIDANAPYLQGKLPSARVLYRLGIVYRTIRLTGVTFKEPHREHESVEYQGHRWTVDMVNTLARPTSYSIVRGEQVPEPDA